jgi:hypothetical protein
MRSFSLAALALSLAGGLPAANIITVANSGVAAPGSVTIASNGPLAVTFTTPAQAFTNVSVSAAVAFHTDLGGASNIAAFLTTSLGAGTTAGAHQIAATGTFLAPNIAANGVAAECEHHVLPEHFSCFRWHIIMGLFAVCSDYRRRHHHQ